VPSPEFPLLSLNKKDEYKLGVIIGYHVKQINELI